MSEFFVTILVGAQSDAGVIASRGLARRRTLRANIERHVNYMPKRTEPGAEKSGFYREQVPGLTLLATMPGAVRGVYWADTRLFVVAGAGLYEVASNWTTTLRGTLSTSSGWVSMAHGLLELVVVDGPSGYALQLGSNVFEQIIDPDFLGSRRVSFLDGKFQFVAPGTQQFFWSSGIDDGRTYDGLDYASAESGPDNIVAHLVDHRELWLFGTAGTEVWSPFPAGDQVYARNNGASIEVGCAAPFTPQKIDNSIYWLGYDKLGQGIVWTAGGQSGYQPIRISTQDLEEAAEKLDDLSGAYAWTYQDAGQTFYCLQIPGLETTWVYDASVKKWHERAEIIDGNFQPWRADVHAFAFGAHVVGDAAGNLYEVDPFEYTFNGAPIYREWTTPHSAASDRSRVTYDSARIDITAGETDSGLAPVIELRYSNDGGSTWSSWRARSSGRVGEYSKPVKWDRLGQGRDRVWQFRTTDNAKVSIIGLAIKSTKGRT